MTTTAPPSVYFMASPTLPTGLSNHFSNWTTRSVVIIGEQAGDEGLRRFLKTVLSHKRQYHDTVLMPAENQPQATASIRGIFDDVATGAEFSFMPEIDLVAALKAHDADDRAVGTCFSDKTGLLTFITGDRQRLAVPVAAIAKHPVMGTPNFKTIGLTDGGHTVTFGAKYEVAFDGLRYEHDPDYRKVVRQRARDQNQSFGACLRRARFHLRLGQGDLGAGARTIRRIENGDMDEAAIRAGTRKQIEAALGLSIEKIKGF